MIGEIYLVVIFVVSTITYFYLTPINEDYDDLNIPIYK
jgi:hypothetical protein